MKWGEEEIRKTDRLRRSGLVGDIVCSERVRPAFIHSIRYFQEPIPLRKSSVCVNLLHEKIHLSACWCCFSIRVRMSKRDVSLRAQLYVKALAYSVIGRIKVRYIVSFVFGCQLLSRRAVNSLDCFDTCERKLWRKSSPFFLCIMPRYLYSEALGMSWLLTFSCTDSLESMAHFLRFHRVRVRA